MNYEYIYCDECDGEIIYCDEETFTCIRCKKKFSPQQINFDRMITSDVTGRKFPVLDTEECEIAQYQENCNDCGFCDEKKVHILGSEWIIKEQFEFQNELLSDCDGYCDWTTKEIVVSKVNESTLGNPEAYSRKILRHEIVHAFLYESGLSECSSKVEPWALNEEMVDWIARQGQRIYKAWEDADALDDDEV